MRAAHGFGLSTGEAALRHRACQPRRSALPFSSPGLAHPWRPFPSGLIWSPRPSAALPAGPCATAADVPASAAAAQRAAVGPTRRARWGPAGACGEGAGRGRFLAFGGLRRVSLSLHFLAVPVGQGPTDLGRESCGPVCQSLVGLREPPRTVDRNHLACGSALYGSPFTSSSS